MFSQWRHAVESLAQPPKPTGSPDLPPPSGEEAPARSSLDSLGIRNSISSSSQLAESALTSLRKSLVAQRPGSPANAPSTNSAATPASKPRAASRTTLEDRLRAKFAIGDASNASSPATSSRASPAPMSIADHPLAAPPSRSPTSDIPSVKGPPNPLSPSSTPLPDSPLVSPSLDPPRSLDASAATISTAAIESPASAGLSTSLFNEVAAEKAEVPVIVEPQPTTGGSPRILIQNEAEDVDAPSTEAPETPNTLPVTQSPEIIPAQAEGESVDVAELPQAIDNNNVAAEDYQSPEVAEEAPSSTDGVAYPLGEDAAKDQNPEISVEHALNDVPAVDTPAGPPLANDPLVEATIPVDDKSPPRSSIDLPSRSATPDTRGAEKADVEGLQKRLKLVEQRFADVSTSFKRLQAEKLAADRVLRELTSVESVTEVDALRDFLQNMSLKNEMAQDEIRRLNGKLTRQDERIEELRDIHRLDSKSQSDQIDRLKAQVEEAEKLLKAAQVATTQIEQESAKRKAEIDSLRTELERATNTAKDEEEKRTKAITLLKSVRQKLVKAEKERDDAQKEIGALKEAEKTAQEKEKAERTRLQGEIDKVNAERETAVQGLRAQFDKEVAALKERHEKELAALRGQFELEAITTKTAHVRELESKKSRISDLENTVKVLSGEKDELFDQLQLRQAELESSQSALESLQGQNTELQYQLREANDRVALLQEEFSDVRREQEVRVQSPGPSAEEVTRLLSAAESKYETRLSDLRRRLAEAERERDEGEAHWSRKFAERAKEVEELKAAISSSQKSKEEEAEGHQALRTEIEMLQAEIRSYQKQVADLHAQLEKTAEVELAAKAQLAEVSSKAADLQQYVDEGKNREAQLRAQNKTLREELRKVQSSVALLEKQRNPGVGYWASRNESTSEIRSPRSSVSDLARESPSRPSTPSTIKSDEEVNFEYLRNVIIQFLEHKEMRPHLVRILSTILHFTPQETRRLVAKV